MLNQIRERLLNRMPLIDRLRSDEDGNILIELALVMPIFATLAMGAYDMGRFAMETSRMEFAARAGAQVVLQNLDALGNLDLVRNEVTDAATVAAGPDVSDLVVVATLFCGCPDGGGGLTAVNCSAFCPDDNVAQKQVIVTASHVVDPVFTIPGVIESQSVVGRFRVTVQ